MSATKKTRQQLDEEASVRLANVLKADRVIVTKEAYMEALSSLYGSRAVLGNISNLSHAIKLLETTVEKE